MEKSQVTPEQGEMMMFVNGRLLPQSHAVTLMQGSAFRRAAGFYDTERTFNGRIFKLRQHLERLYRGLAAAGLDPGMSLDGMEAATLEVLEANRPRLAEGQEFVLTQVVSVAPEADPGGPANVVIYCQYLDFARFALGYVRGVHLVTPATYSFPITGHTDGRLPLFPLMMDAEGNVTECAGANFMFVRDGRIKLPDRRSVLPGISMQTVLELAEGLGIPVDEGDYGLLDVYGAEEAFVSSTRFCLQPVARVNSLRIGSDVPGPVTQRLTQAWRQLVGLDFVRQALEHLPPEEAQALGAD